MATAIDFDHLGIGAALKQNRLAVPRHQREYSWEEKHVDDLFDDLAHAIDDKRGSYFLGTIVLTQGTEGGFMVIDGQQRLATTTMLLAAIRDHFLAKGDDLLVTDLDDFLRTIVRESRTTVPRLRLNVDDRGFFEQRVIEHPGSRLRNVAKPTKPSHHRIEKAAQLAKHRVERILTPLSPKHQSDRLIQWVSFVEKSVQVILVKAGDDANAYVMFETLNDRGLDTTQADLVKNHLFQHSGDRLNEAHSLWSTMKGTLESVGDDVILTYLRHFIISRFGYTRERDVLERIRDKTRSPAHSLDILERLADSAHNYVALLSADHGRWNRFQQNIRQHVRTLRMLGLVPLRPLMLAVVSNFSKGNVERSFRLFVSWSVRFLIAGGGRSGATEKSLAEAASLVSNGKIKTTAELQRLMDEVVPTDSDFEAEFSTARVSRSMLARYYLRALELKRKQDAEPEWIPNDDIVINLEHVLPGSPNLSEWPDFDEESARGYTKRLGNLVLMQATQNTVAANNPFVKKAAQYEKSTFLLTKEVGQETSWGPAQINDRQRQLAKLAVETWPINVL